MGEGARPNSTARAYSSSRTRAALGHMQPVQSRTASGAHRAEGVSGAGYDDPVSRTALLALGLVAGCGRLGFDERALTSGDGGDGSMDATCWSHWFDHTIALTTPQLVAELGTATETSDAWVTGDGLTLYYVVQASSPDIHYATRSATDQPWVPRGPVTELAATGIDTKLTVTADGLVGAEASVPSLDVVFLSVSAAARYRSR